MNISNLGALQLGAVKKMTFVETVEEKSTRNSQKLKEIKKIMSGDTQKLDDPKKYADKIKNNEKISGFFTFYRNKDDNNVLMEIKPKQLDKMFLCSVTRIAGKGVYFSDSEAQLFNFPIIIKKIGNKLQFIRKNLEFRADAKNPINKSIQRGISDILLKTVEIEAINPKNGNILINPTKLFINAIENVGSLNEGDSYFESIKSFPKNTEIEAVLNFSDSKKVNFFHKYNYSLTPLPQENYMPRLNDPKVGYFKTTYDDLSNPESDSTKINYINRWKLEKKNPLTELSGTKKPIVFWIENTVPEEYKGAVRKGIEIWNKAFEKAGFKDAILVKEQPKNADWDPADISYNTISWIVNPSRAYAVGPSFANPLNGQLYAADIRISENFLRALSSKFDNKIKPLEDTKNKKSNSHSCRFTADFAKEMNTKLAYLESQGIIKNKEEKEKFLQDSLSAVIAHEVGHTLGLRHNFEGSAIKIQDGRYGSIMDYLPIEIKDGPDGLKYYIQTEPGPYDEWAIEYGYKPIPGAKTPQEEKEHLKKIISKGYPYGPDEETDLDPNSNLFDLGDPIQYHKNEILFSKKALKNIEKHLSEKPNAHYSEVRKAFNSVIYSYYGAIENISKYIGGIYYNRGTVKELKDKLPLEPVSKEKQLEALNFLKEEILSPDSFKFSPELLKKLAPDEQSSYENGNYSLDSYPVHERIMNIQNLCLNKIYSPDVLNRILDNELKYKENPFKMSKFFSTLRGAIFSELKDNANINTFRVNLQQSHISKLIELYKDEKINSLLLTKPALSNPSITKALARIDLLEIKREIDDVLTWRNKKLDLETKAHLENIKAQIIEALKLRGEN